MRKCKIGDLKTDKCHPTYRLSDGSTWTKLNNTLHAPAVQVEGEWHCAGEVKGLDPNEEVDVLEEQILEAEHLVS